MNATFRAANRAYDDMRLNAHLRDWDVSEERDRAIDERADELLGNDYEPFGDTVVDQFCDEFDLRDVLGDTLQHLIAGDHTAAGAACYMVGLPSGRPFAAALSLFGLASVVVLSC